jgi:hypothetical protein
MYTLLALNATLALYFLARLLTDRGVASAVESTESGLFGYAKRHGKAWLRAPGVAPIVLSWFGLVFFTVATMLSHNTALLFPLSMNLFILGFIFWRRRHGTSAPVTRATGSAPLTPPSLRSWLGSQAATLLLWSPWFTAFVTQARGVYDEFWIPKPTLVIVTMAVGAFFGAHLPVNVGLIGAITVAFAVLLALGAFYLRGNPALLALLLTAFVVPFAGELLISLRRPIFYDRTLIYVTIPLYLLLAAGILQLRVRTLMLGALVALVAINGLSLREYYTNFEKEQWREAAAAVASELQPNDLLLFNATWVQIPFDFYFRDAGLTVEERGAPVDLFDRGILEPKMAESDVPRLEELVRGRERVWLIYSHNWYTDPKGIVPRVLGAELELLKERPFYGLDVRLYGARD